MLAIFRKTASSFSRSAGSTPSSSSDDLSAWEFVSAPFSDDEDGVRSVDGDDVITEAPSEPDQKPMVEIARASRDFVNPKMVLYSITCLSVSPRTTSPISLKRAADDESEEADLEDESDDSEDDERDYDDELVPWKLKHMLGKQRIRKMGKKGGRKVTKSKKQAYYHNRPGCLYGKHGFGVQHSFV